MGFSNKIIHAPRPRKPHIVYMYGYWRVSVLLNPRNPVERKLWFDAHDYTNKLNNQLIEERLKTRDERIAKRREEYKELYHIGKISGEALQSVRLSESLQ